MSEVYSQIDCGAVQLWGAAVWLLSLERSTTDHAFSRFYRKCPRVKSRCRLHTRRASLYCNRSLQSLALFTKRSIIFDK